MLNIIDTLADYWSLLSATIFFQMSPLDLYFGLRASFNSLCFACYLILRFHLAAILLVELPPNGNTCCGVKMPAGISASAAPILFSISMSVMHCVVAVPLSEMRLLAQTEWPALDVTMVQSLLPSWSYAMLQQGVGIGP